MTTAYHMTFNDPVHFGIEGIGQENIEQTMRSDALWGAILQKWFLLFDDDPDTLCTHTSFTLSSCFPVINGVRFYPLPVGALDDVIEEAVHKPSKVDELSVKDWRKVKFIAEPLINKVLAGAKLRLDEIEYSQLYPVKNQQKAVSATNRLYRREQRPRVKTDQLNGGVEQGAFFYCTDQFFEPSSGLFFLADFESKESKDKFEASLRLLCDSGLGADRSIGRGGFSCVAKQPELFIPKNPSTWLTLSLYHPTRKEVEQGVLNNAGSRYSLVRRSGRAGSVSVSRFRRADCWMLEEGAIVPCQVHGDTPCVLLNSNTIPHNVYRNGRAFCIPFQGGEKG